MGTVESEDDKLLLLAVQADVEMVNRSSEGGSRSGARSVRASRYTSLVWSCTLGLCVYLSGETGAREQVHLSGENSKVGFLYSLFEMSC